MRERPGDGTRLCTTVGLDGGFRRNDGAEEGQERKAVGRELNSAVLSCAGQRIDRVSRRAVAQADSVTASRVRRANRNSAIVALACAQRLRDDAGHRSESIGTKHGSVKSATRA